MFHKEPKLIKFYGFEAPDGSGILYGSTDPKIAEDIAHGMKTWKDVVTGEAADLYGVPQGAKKKKKKKQKKQKDKKFKLKRNLQILFFRSIKMNLPAIKGEMDEYAKGLLYQIIPNTSFSNICYTYRISNKLAGSVYKIALNDALPEELKEWLKTIEFCHIKRQHYAMKQTLDFRFSAPKIKAVYNRLKPLFDDPVSDIGNMYDIFEDYIFKMLRDWEVFTNDFTEDEVRYLDTLYPDECIIDGQPVIHLLPQDVGYPPGLTANEYLLLILRDPEKLLEIFKLSNVENKFVILQNMNEADLDNLLPYLTQDQLAMGLNFFTDEKLMTMAEQLPIETLCAMIFEKFTLDDVMAFMDDASMNTFLMQPDVEKKYSMSYFESLDAQDLTNLMTKAFGADFEQKSQKENLEYLSSLTDNQYNHFIQSIEREEKMKLINGITSQEPDLIYLFEAQDIVASVV